MITLLRWYLYKSREIKWKCAFWMELDKQLTTIVKNPEEIEKKIMPYLAKLVHESSEKMMNGEGSTVK